ncbi:isoprenylcysteine carboxylmethyltransferase family protein [Candidatus Lokiarchaeum ossiferum]|uniref:isoprenylcysteine carboxylmethyltransferase family protein n=1 Tax=Candidatus Lokiarchaeum ossiferum TaxID=2951803 RepID=UPI00352BEF23
MGFGVIIAALGRIGRGSYLSNRKPRLSTKYGRRIVRHPEYLMYILFFVSFPFITLNLYFLLLLPEIWAYYHFTKSEEIYLIEEFGQKYIDYSKKVGRFIPKIWLRKKQ